MKTKLLAGLTLGLGLALAVPAHAQIRLGVAGPITGPNASFGAQLRNGVEQAVEDINAAGGILGQRITLSIGDDVSDPRQGVSVANKFIGDGVRFIVGHFNSGVTMPASEVYAENGAVFITPSATNPRITERGLWNAFRTCGRDDQQGAVAAAYLVRNFAGKRVAIVHDKTTYGKGLADETQKAMNAAGLKEVIYEGVNTGEKDFSALISKLKAANVDIVYWGGLHTEGGLIVRQMRDQGVTAPMMSGDGIADNEFADVVTDALAGLFPDDPPRFMARTPHGHHDVERIRHDLKAAGFAQVAVDTVDARSRAPSARHVAVAYCQGTPLRNEIEARDAARLEEATDRAAGAVAARFGSGAVDGRIRAIVVSAATP